MTKSKSKTRVTIRSAIQKSRKRKSGIRPAPASSRVAARPYTKHAHIMAMLRISSGTTIAAMMNATGWQQHSVRGFLAGVVCKRLKLKLGSKKVDGNRVYRIAVGGGTKSGVRRSKRRSS